MSGEWEYKTLFEVIDEVFDRRGVTPTKLGGEFSDSGHRVISAKSVKQNRIDLNADEPRFVSDELFARWMRSPLASDDVILTSEAPLGELAYLSDDVDWCLGQRLFALRTDKQQLDGRYLFYALQSEGVAHDLQTRATGTTVVGIRQSELLKVEIPLPPLPEQRRIAKILGDLDDKIELNRTMNETLEQMARALFKSWFVDFDPVRAKMEGRQPTGMDAATAALFPDRLVDSELGPIPEGWEVKALDSIATFLNGLALQKYPASGGQTLRVIKIAQLRSGNTVGADECSSEIPGDYIIEDGDVLFSWSGSLEVELWCGGSGALNQHLFKVTSSETPKWFFYQWLRHHLPEFREIAADKATTMGHIQRRHLTEALVLVPGAELITAMTNAMQPIHNQLINNNIQSRTLSTLRDTLLPKLVSGEVKTTN